MGESEREHRIVVERTKKIKHLRVSMMQTAMTTTAAAAAVAAKAE